MNSSQRFSYEQLREQINDELLKKDMPQRLYKSTNGIFKIIEAIVKTKGNGWTAHVLNNEGEVLLSENEQKQFTTAFEPYIDSIINFFGHEKDLDYNLHSIKGGVVPDPSVLSGLSPKFLETKLKQTTGLTNVKDDPTKMFGVDDIYSKMVNKIKTVDTSVNDYASKYGILHLEKKYDLEPDIRLIPEPLQALIATGVEALAMSIGFEDPLIASQTKEILDKIKLPFRTIIFTIYLILDITRVAMAISDRSMGRKVLSILVSILELLRGDWKKAVLSFMGFYGKTPLFVGQILKVLVSLFETLAPQLQNSIIFGALDTTKSMLVGILLAIFQVSAPEEVRLPLIGILEKIAEKKAEIDGSLTEAGLSARPKYLSPTFDDLNNIQALISDEAFICSCEFEDLIKQVNNSAILRAILQILRIPVTQEFKELKCGTEPCKPIAEKIVDESIQDTAKEEELEKPVTTQLPISTTELSTELNRKRGGRRTLHSQKNKLIF